MIDEKRAFYRLPMTFPVETSTGNPGTPTDIKGQTVDISVGGLRVMTKAPLNSFHKITAYLNLPPCYSPNPEKSLGIQVKGHIVWSKTIGKNRKYLSGMEITSINDRSLSVLKDIIRYEKEKSSDNIAQIIKPKINIHREIHSCNMYAVDLTVGCGHDCTYCHFSTLQQEEWVKKNPVFEDFPIPVDIRPLYAMKELPDSVVYLSPSSDPFAPAAKKLTHEILSFMLPKGVIFTISTKGIIPKRTIRLLKKYHHLIEGIAIGVTNLDKKRNDLLEPTISPAEERLEHIKELKEIGCSIGIRMDPIFPLIDDSNKNFDAVIERATKNGIVHLSATYLFTFGKFLKKLSKVPGLQESIKLIREKEYPIGGIALSAPLEYRKRKYDKLNEICKKYGVKFSTCGCKQMSLQKENYSLICRNLAYYNKKI